MENKKIFWGLLTLIILFVSVPVNALESVSINEEEISITSDIDKDDVAEKIEEEVSEEDSASDTDTTIINEEQKDVITDNNGNSIP